MSSGSSRVDFSPGPGITAQSGVRLLVRKGAREVARLSLKEIEGRVEALAAKHLSGRELLFELLLAYGRSQNSVTRLRSGSLSVATDPEHEVAQKKIVYFRELPPVSTEEELLAAGEELRSSEAVRKFQPRFLIVMDDRTLLAWDTVTAESTIFPINQITQHVSFFLPWAGMEKTQFIADTHADIKAAERMGELFDELLAANPDLAQDPTARHGLNVFFTRLLFCFFAEDTGIFEPNQFTNAVGSHTLEDGSDVQDFLADLFLALDTANPDDKPSYLATFPYVNGRLFAADQALTVPHFTRKARRHLLGLGSLIWQEINPDIFGSMFQAIVTPDQRSDLGQHYTSVPNILKTIEPLFLDGLREDFDAVQHSAPKLRSLLARLGDIRVFDPACGSGNFLVIAYKELRRLEHQILERLAELDPAHNTLFTDSVINIEHFYGIEIDDFAVEVAILSLWIAKHQMNEEFRDKFGVSIPLIPLKEVGSIHAGNATRLDWNEVCLNDGDQEIYLIGNPPYVGSSMQSKEQKEDFSIVFGERKYGKNLDYISLWFVKGADYIRGTRARLAFVSTNSVAQGDHVGLMFPTVLDRGIEIGYAYPSFKWENNAKGNAGVSVVVISLRNASREAKYLFIEDRKQSVENINAYLSNGPDVIVPSRRQPLSAGFPEMTWGSKPSDGGNLILEPSEASRALEQDSRIERFLKKYVGAAEFIRGRERYCLWIEDEDAELARGIPAVARRLEGVKASRLASKAPSTIEYAEYPHRFRQRAYRPTHSIIVPGVSSERRDYVPMGYLGPDTVISNKGFAVYEAEAWLFAVLTSRIHMVWLRAVGGKMKTDFSYSNTLVYNTFPLPDLTQAHREELTQRALRVLDVREYHYELTPAELYDPDTMPADLREAHARLDDAVDQLYQTRPFTSDEERLAALFTKYEELLELEQHKDTAAQKAKGPRKPARRRSSQAT